MRIETNATILDQFGWAFRIRPLDEMPKRVLLLLHGWTGDENSMWAFTRNFPTSYALIAPRAPYLAPKDRGGYSWRELKPGTWGSPTLEELRSPVDALVSLVDKWSATLNIVSLTFDVVGFSQGAALGTLMAALYPERVRKLAVLAGFVPKGAESLFVPGLFANLQCFWAHGTEDELIPIERGRLSMSLLEQAGAQLHFCEANVGHRVSRDCRRALDTFLRS